MLRNVIAAGVASLTIGCGAASAQSRAAEAEARLVTAKAHVETVCRPLEERRRYRLATRCYGNVVAYLDNPMMERVAPLPPFRVAAPRLIPSEEPVYRAPRRAPGLFASNYVLLGVGF